MDKGQMRRSIRKYTGREVSMESIERIIEAGRNAPTASNRQGARFIVVDGGMRGRLVSMGSATFINDSPIGILVCYDNRTGNMEYRDDIQSGAACVQAMITEAWEMGIGSCWVCHLPKKEELRRLFGIPKEYDPIAYVTLGYPASMPDPPKRKHDDVVGHNRWKRERRRLGISLKRKKDYWCHRCGGYDCSCKGRMG